MWRYAKKKSLKKEKCSAVVRIERNELGKWSFLASFSLDGNYIYTINEKQEICKIYLGDLKIAMKRRIEGLSNPEEVISSHIQQVTPKIFAIGSVIRTEVENPEQANFKAYLHLVCGDFADLKEELGVKKFETPLLEAFDPKRPLVFRTLYIKERYKEICCWSKITILIKKPVILWS